MSICIIDYGLGNLASIRNMIRKAGGKSEISADPAAVAAAEKLILPGVGHFAAGMENLRNSGLLPVLNEAVLEQKIPILGICLGMQLMAKHSEEGDVEGLGWFDANIIRFRQEAMGALKVPHMGWNEVKPTRPHPLFPNIQDPERFYFVHSYHWKCNNPEDALAHAHYGYDFTCAVSRENIAGMQFHPEKSHRFGMEMMHRFIQWKP
ncbi:MAG: imidazole glycerol phosphate synthase, glutamine amidotransferase subunit [Bacteroidota bacterium]|jgi:glutamine amidotransferase